MLEAEFREEVLKLERKYQELYTPLYQRRHEIITGAKEPTDEECEREVSDLEEEVGHASLQELDNNEQPVEKKEPVKGALPAQQHVACRPGRPWCSWPRPTRWPLRDPTRRAGVLADRPAHPPGGERADHPRG